MTEGPDKLWIDLTGEDELGMFVASPDDTYENMDVCYIRMDIHKAMLKEREKHFKLLKDMHEEIGHQLTQAHLDHHGMSRKFLRHGVHLPWCMLEALEEMIEENKKDE